MAGPKPTLPRSAVTDRRRPRKTLQSFLAGKKEILSDCREIIAGGKFPERKKPATLILGPAGAPVLLNLNRPGEPTRFPGHLP